MPSRSQRGRLSQSSREAAERRDRIRMRDVGASRSSGSGARRGSQPRSQPVVPTPVRDPAFRPRSVYVILHRHMNVLQRRHSGGPLKNVYVILERMRVGRQAEQFVTPDRLRVALQQIMSAACGVPAEVQPQVPALLPPPRVPAVERPTPRRRHAEVPLKVTHRHAILYNSVVETRYEPYTLGAMSVACPHCGARFFEGESPYRRADIFARCCSRGDVALPELGECPGVLRELLTADDHPSVEFRRNIRSANSLFAMASFKTSIPEDRNVGQGSWSFNICGQIYHYAERPPVTTQERREPILNQYYFVDAEDAIERRAAFLEDRISRVTLERLEYMLRETNELVHAWMTVREVIDHMRRSGEGDVDDIVVGFRERMGEHLRTHNLPESRSDVAAVFSGTDPPFSLDFAVYPRERQVRCELKNLSRLTDPMVYPLLFPRGEPGYDMRLRRRLKPDRTVSMNKFYRYRIQTRRGFSLLHNGGKLFQQYLVDAYVRVESSRLWYLRQNDIQTRMAQHVDITRMLEARNRGENVRVGKVVILPASFYGSPRSMNRLYLDAMTIVSRHGKPDLFITMTCNPKWREITENLEHKQTYQNRPDLVCRVFNAKLNEFLDDVTSKQLFGVLLNYMYVIEIQKRGLPHAHILLTLRPEEKLDDEDALDSVICATIPDEETEPVMHGIVGEFYVHRTCGADNPGAPCMKDGRCSKGYPKEYRDRTTLVGDAPSRQPVYKRPRDGRTVTAGNTVYDNSRIVPYNRYAAMRYRCHINFEACGSAATVKYLHKYVTKGPDCITIQTRDARSELEWDEIRSFVECRYVSATEAAWRLLEFPMHGRSHSVMCLPVHLPNDPVVVFDENDLEEDIVRAASKPTKLEMWFRLNVQDVNARQYKYVDIPEHYVWQANEAAWTPRRQVSKQLGCLVDVSPNNVELFHLRILLQHVRGAMSYEHLRTLDDGTVCADFFAACVQRNLLERGDEYDRCLAEAAPRSHPARLRRLFALLCILCMDQSLDKVPHMWETHRLSLCEDFLRGREDPRSVREAEFRALRAVQAHLEANREYLTLEGVGLPGLDGYGDVAGDCGEPHVADDDGGAPSENADALMAALNPEQRKVFLAVVAAIRDYVLERGVAVPAGAFDEVLEGADGATGTRDVRARSAGRAFYLDGPGGTGKTFLYNRLLDFVRRRLGLPAAAVAWTGIAATLLKGGRTCHSTFRLPLELTETTVAGHPIGSSAADAMRDVAIIVWDEAPMTPRLALRAVDVYLRDIMDSPNTPFGGKVLLLGGDFRQVLPVVVGGHSAEVIGASIRASFLWSHLTQHSLSTNMRAQARGGGHAEYSAYLLQMGEGRLPHVRLASAPHAARDMVELPTRCLLQTAGELFDFVFPVGECPEGAAGRCILCPTNASADTINGRILERLDAPERTYHSVDSYTGGDDDDFHVPIDLLNSVAVASLPPHDLKLKVGAVVMLLRNLSIGEGQCNGVRLMVRSLGDHMIEVETLTGDNRGKIFWLPKVKMTARDPKLPKPMTRIQFPVKLAYAMTINKAQGQTFQKVGIYLDKPCFSHGQLYVAFSRVGSFEDVRIFVENSPRQGAFKFRTMRRFTRNVVYDAVVGATGTVPVVDVDDVPQSEDQALLARLRNRARQVPRTRPPEAAPRKNPAVQTGGNGEPIDEVDVHVRDLPEDFLDALRTRSNDEAKRAEEREYMFRTTQDLRQRVAVDERPGTTGLYLDRCPGPPIHDYSSDSD